MKKADVARMIEEGRQHLEFVCWMYRRQLRNGKWFLHEHPATAVSWSEKNPP